MSNNVELLVFKKFVSKVDILSEFKSLKYVSLRGLASRPWLKMGNQDQPAGSANDRPMAMT